MFDYAAYEKACAKVQEKNEEYLDLFEMELKKSGLSEKTVLRHLRNVDFYINTYLLREEPRPWKMELCSLISFWAIFLSENACGQLQEI